VKTSFLHRTVRSTVTAVGAALRDHTLLKATIAARLGDEAAMLLADPVVSSQGNHIDWYVTGQVEPVPLSVLPETERAAVEAKLAEYRTQIDALADEVAQRRGPRDLQLAESLRGIFTVPGPQHVYAVDGQPVLVEWAHRQATGREERVGLAVPAGGYRPAAPMAADPQVPPEIPTDEPVPVRQVQAQTAATPTPMSAPVVSVRSGLGWLAALLWLLFAALIIVILALLLRACALAPYLGWLGIAPACGAQSTVDIASLELVAADLEDQVRRAAQPCPEPEQPTDAVEQAEERTRDTQRGDLEIALIWQTEDDLDLHVFFNCNGSQPSTIGFRQRSACGGILDQDANANQTSTTPAEHIVWVDSADVPPGEMQVSVHYYGDKGPRSAQIPYQVVIKRGDTPPQVIDGTIRDQELVTVTTLQN